ncbi:MAG: glycosyltransferase family 2 protein [Planctomycetota bacterium]
MKVSLFIPTWNGEQELQPVLTALAKQPGIEDIEKLAIDSSSSDDTVELLRSHGFEVEVRPQSEFDHGRTRDAGIERASGDIVLLLTQDAIPADQNWLSSLISAYDEPNAAAAYCKQIPREDCNPFIARRLREWTAGKNERAIQERASAEEFQSLEPMDRLQRCAYDNVAGSVRKRAWRDLGGFGSRPFGEDVAFGKKAILGGYDVVFEASSAVVHSHNRSPKAEGKRIYCDHQNLRDLFGILLFPTWQSCRDGIAWAEVEYVRVVEELGLPDSERDELSGWARDYARWASLGMFLGARSQEHMSGPHGETYRALDRAMHSGI